MIKTYFDENDQPVIRQFKHGDRVRDAFGEVFTVDRQRGCQVFVQEHAHGWYHPTKLWRIK